MNQDKVKAYYDYTLRPYRLFWHGDTNAIHYGIWDESVKNFQGALLNTNKFLAEKANIRSGEKVLDAGCGVGGSAFWLAKNKGAHIIGITISEKQLAKAKGIALKLGLENKTEFYLQDFTKTNFPDESFDVVWAIESSCYALDKLVFLKEAYRLLKPGGRLIIGDGFLGKEPQNKKEEIMLKNFLKGFILDNLANAKEFGGLMKTAGFKNVQSWDETQEILPTAIPMAKMSRWSWPLSIITTWLHLTPQLLVDNNRAGIDQLYLFKNRILLWCVFLAEK